MTLREIAQKAKNIVFFGGAGVSTESGIPDFRSADGLYSQKYPYPPEIMLSHSFFKAHTEDFFAFYREKLIHPAAKPGPAHKKLAELEAGGKLSALITQNIDGLHSMAGSKNVLELHGSILRNRCMGCGRAYPLSYVTKSAGIPHCACGDIVKPDVVLYEEPLDEGILEAAVQAVRKADCLLVGGTSLNVYPAAGLINYFRGSHLVLINKTATPYDNKADLVVHDSIGAVLGTL